MQLMLEWIPCQHKATSLIHVTKGMEQHVQTKNKILDEAEAFKKNVVIKTLLV